MNEEKIVPKVGRRSYQPNDADRLKVQKLCALGTPLAHIAIAIGITPTKLRKNYRKELTEASIEANTKVAETLYTMATSGKYPSATIFWDKTRNSSITPAPPSKAEASQPAKPPTPRPPSTIVVLNNDGGPIDLD